MISKIQSATAPEAIGPYSQGALFNKLLITSGQIPLDPNTGKVVDGDIKVQARQALNNLQAILEAGGANLGTVLKTTCYLQDMADFAAFNDVYTEFFGQSLPARSCVAVACLPKAALCEIEAIAYRRKV